MIVLKIEMKREALKLDHENIDHKIRKIYHQHEALVLVHQIQQNIKMGTPQQQTRSTINRWRNHLEITGKIELIFQPTHRFFLFVCLFRSFLSHLVVHVLSPVLDDRFQPVR